MVKKIFLILSILVCTKMSIFAQIPPKPNPPRLVNDFAHLLTASQIDEKERRLVAFNDSTTNVICIVTIDDLGEYTAAEFAYEIGDQWGVKSDKENGDRDNGVVLLIKPRNSSPGEVYISVGYDLEPVITDIAAKRIIDRKMIPELANGNYNAAIDSALAYLLPLAAGEINEDRLYDDDEGEIPALLAALFIVAIIVIFVYFSKGNHHTKGGGTFRDTTIFPGNIWSDYGGSNYGGGFGGGSGGFGGFGGFGGSGGFGGGGAGGRF